MTTHAPLQQPTTYPPGAYVYDVVANDVGRVADPSAHPTEALGRACALVVPLGRAGRPWQAEPGALRPLNANEIEAASR